ncbi:rhodopsin, G0-coupled-like [Liolophura sinensis]|uniref:rhodopsin, G0-coupled-like n=1 Tax=Liolophura sinensis TaxID=3198878 RepID=UPI003158663E
MYGNTSVDDMPPGLLSPAQFTVITCFLTLCGVVGLVINSVTFLVFVAVPSLRCPTNLFIMAVLSCDLIMSTVGIPFEAVASVHNRWVFGAAGCSWHGFIMSFLGYTSIYLLTAISVERYLLITNPFSRPLITNTRAVGVIVACVTLALLLSAFPVIGWSSYQLEAALISCSVNWQSAFLLCWTPYAAVSLWSAFGNPSDVSPVAGTVPSLIAKSSVVWNPLIYVLTNKQFRSRFITVFTFRVRSQTRLKTQERANERIEMKLLTKESKGESSSQNYKSVQMYKESLQREGSHYCRTNALGDSCSNPFITLTMEKSDVAPVSV